MSNAAPARCQPRRGPDFHPGSGIYPSLVYGRFLDPPPHLPERLVATLDGRPVAVAFTVDRGAGFATLIPPSAFRPGENDLQVYAPSGGG
ncbi:MAG: hypothetical protein U0R52_12495 [Solirubrobacterales bacterium]